MCEILIRNVVKDKGKLTAIINVFCHRDLAGTFVKCGLMLTIPLLKFCFS